jgi:hypothetical protein
MLGRAFAAFGFAAMESLRLDVALPVRLEELAVQHL